MGMFIKNDEGKPSVSLTMVVISFTVVTLWLIAWVIGVALGFPIPAFDALAGMGYLMPILSLYFGRRWNSKSDHKNQTMEASLAEEVVTTTTTTTK